MRTGRLLAALVVLFVVVAGVAWAVMLSRLPDELAASTAHVPEVPAETPRPEPSPPAAPTPPPNPVAPPTPRPARPPVPSQPPAAPAEAPEPTPAPEMPIDPPGRNGPVEELEAAFASEPRDAESYAFEEVIESTFEQFGMDESLLEWAECHQSVCRIDTLWTPERAAGFMQVLTTLVMKPEEEGPHTFETMMAVDPDEPRHDGVHPISVYVRRRR